MNYYGIHPSLDTLELYLLNRANEDETATVEEHLLVCDACRAMAEALEHEIEMLREALTEEETEAQSISR